MKEKKTDYLSLMAAVKASGLFLRPDLSTLTRSPVRLCKGDLITFDVGLANAPNPDEFRLNMQGMFTGVDSLNLEDGKR